MVLALLSALRSGDRATAEKITARLFAVFDAMPPPTRHEHPAADDPLRVALAMVRARKAA
jgi:hypothetical protein